MLLGMGMFRPPSRHGKDNRSLSNLQQGSQPVRAGIKFDVSHPPMAEIKSPLIQ